MDPGTAWSRQHFLAATVNRTGRKKRSGDSRNVLQGRRHPTNFSGTQPTLGSMIRTPANLSGTQWTDLPLLFPLFGVAVLTLGRALGSVQNLALEATPGCVGRVSRRRTRVTKAEASVTRATATIAVGMPAMSAISPDVSAPIT